MLAGGLSRHDPPAYLISSGLVWSRLVWSVLVWSVVVVEPQSLSSACIACALLDRGIALDGPVDVTGVICTLPVPFLTCHL